MGSKKQCSAEQSEEEEEEKEESEDAENGKENVSSFPWSETMEVTKTFWKIAKSLIPPSAGREGGGEGKERK